MIFFEFSLKFIDFSNIFIDFSLKFIDFQWFFMIPSEARPPVRPAPVRQAQKPEKFGLREFAFFKYGFY